MSITLQYIIAVMIGDSSPATTASIVSSRRFRPATTSPCSMSARPWAWRAAAVRSASRKLSDRDGLAGGRVRRIGLALAQLLLGDGDGHIAALDAVPVLDEPLASRNPGV